MPAFSLVLPFSSKTLVFHPSSSVSKMEVIRDDLCFILDLEGFFINKTFHVRELGYYTWNEEHRRHAFRIPVPRQDLAQKDRQTVNFVIRKIHGLSYQPSQAEHPPNHLPRGALSLHLTLKIFKSTFFLFPLRVTPIPLFL